MNFVLLALTRRDNILSMLSYTLMPCLQDSLCKNFSHLNPKYYCKHKNVAKIRRLILSFGFLKCW